MCLITSFGWSDGDVARHSQRVKARNFIHSSVIVVLPEQDMFPNVSIPCLVTGVDGIRDDTLHMSLQILIMDRIFSVMVLTDHAKRLAPHPSVVVPGHKAEG